MTPSRAHATVARADSLDTSRCAACAHTATLAHAKAASINDRRRNIAVKSFKVVSPDYLYSTLTSSAYSTFTASVYSTFTSSAALAFVVYHPGARHGLGRHLCCQRLVLVAAENRAERHAVGHVANYQKREGGGKEQAHPAEHHDVERVIVEDVFDERLEGERRRDFGDDDEEVEDAHVDAHPLGRQRARKYRVRHRENRGPSDADADHRQQQNPLVVYE